MILVDTMNSNSLIVQLTNDDGPESPLFEPFVHELRRQSWIKELRVVIPNSNYSWISCALTRKNSVSVESRQLGEQEIKLVAGTPGDCANLGFHSLYNGPPDLIISGPNLGQNAGAPFTLSSGTLGGAIIGYLTGVKASIAVSAELNPSIWEELNRTAGGHKLEQWNDSWGKIAEVSALMVQRIFEANLHTRGGIVNINLPWGVTEETPIRLTKIQPGKLPRFFDDGVEGVFHHSFNYPEFSDANDNQRLDHECVMQKKISVSIINPYHSTLDFSDEEERAILARVK